MKKLRSDARWHTFTPAQQLKIQQWLFDDHFSYRKTHELMGAELGLSCALSTVGPIYHRLAELRANDAFRKACEVAGQVAGSGVNLETLRSASQKALAARFLQEATYGANVQDIATLGRLMLKGDKEEAQ